MNSEIVVPLLHKSRPIGALNILSRNRDQFTAVRRLDRAPVRRARRGRAGERAPLRAQPSRRRRVRNAGGDRPRRRLDPRRRRAAHAHRAADQAADRLPHLRLLPAERRTTSSRSRSRCKYGEKVEIPRIGARAKGWSATPRCTAKPVLVPDVSQDPRYIKVVDDVRSELAIPLLLKDRCIGVIDLESPELGRVLQARRRDPDAARRPGGGRDREREPLRGAAREPGAAREGGPLRAARPDGAAARRAAEAAEGRRSRRGLRAGARARRRLPRLPVARVEHAGRRARRRVGQGRSGGALQRVRRGARARPHVPPPLPAGSLEPRGRAVVGQHDPAPAAARGVLLHALLRGVRPETAHPDDGELGAAVSDPLVATASARRSSCRACRSDRSRAPPTTRSRSRCMPATCSCSARTASPRR